MAAISPKVTLSVSAAMLAASVACAAVGLSAARAAKHPLRPLPVARYSGPMSGELIEDDAQLRQVMPEVKFDSMKLGQAIDALRRMSGANIFVNWRRLEELPEHFGPNTPVSMEVRLKNVTLGQAIAKVLDCADPSRHLQTRTLGYGIRDSIITISEGWPDVVSVGRWYYVQDLINDPAHYGLDRPQTVQDVGPTTRGGLFANEPPVNSRQEIIDQLVMLITESVDPESWRDNGGTAGSIRSWAGRLIIHQTPENHQKIESMLNNLRKGP